MQSTNLLNKLTTRLAIFVIFFLLTVSLMDIAAFAQEQPAQPPQTQTPNIQAATCQGAELQFKSAPISGNECAFSDGSTAPEEKLNQLVASIVNLFSVVVGVVSVIMIIYGGFRYIISGGDSGNVTNAKNTILYAIIGLVIVAFAQFIVKFVLAKAAGVGA